MPLRGTERGEELFRNGIEPVKRLRRRQHGLGVPVGSSTKKRSIVKELRLYF